MQRWVYKTIVIRELSLSDTKLNAEGEHGWELIAVLGQDGHTARAFFKQPFDENSPLTDGHRVTSEQSAMHAPQYRTTGEHPVALAPEVHHSTGEQPAAQVE